jgi:hypothetical protein
MALEIKAAIKRTTAAKMMDKMYVLIVVLF